MNKKNLAALGIIIVAIILVVINEFSELTFVKDYALILIIGGMFLGIYRTKLFEKSKEKNK